ncbi:hypothetical protein SEPCBS57363_001833 [Sporothrix epigloea]|uniref:Uncharacterized protein n=1 Tax=Sporothrix epigloea TaxID=1892477 RepID=A0ABP0DCG0_9PEZI
MAEATDKEANIAAITALIADIEKDDIFCDDALHGLVQATLEDWTAADLETVGRAHLTKLGRILRQRGVYVGSHNAANGGQAQSLLDTVNVEEPLEWPKDTL